MTSIPLAVDLDGTLVLTDTLHESALRAVREHPLASLQMPLWLMQGKAHLKQKLAGLTAFDPASLPYNQALLQWLKAEHAHGRKLVLCTAADRSIATAVADHLGIFDEVMASDGSTNLSSHRKADALEARFGAGGFDYAGNARPDLEVWQRARHAIVVNAGASVERAARKQSEVERVFAPVQGAGLPRTLRMHQWLKNLLLVIAPLAAHIVPDATFVITMLIAFLAFSLCASAVYIANDLFDLDSDRRHPRKHARPFASGRVSVLRGVLLAPVLLALAFLLANSVGAGFVYPICGDMTTMPGLGSAPAASIIDFDENGEIVGLS